MTTKTEISIRKVTREIKDLEKYFSTLEAKFYSKDNFFDLKKTKGYMYLGNTHKKTLKEGSNWNEDEWENPKTKNMIYLKDPMVEELENASIELKGKKSVLRGLKHERLEQLRQKRRRKK